MDVYLIRHADAVPLGQRGTTEDEQRPLSEAGEAQSKALGEALRRHGVELGAIMTSPLLRARQTADLALRAWSSTAPQLTIRDELALGGKPKKVARLLRDWGGANVAIVGHQPDLGRLAAWLIGSNKAHIDLGKGGVAFIKCEGEPRKGSGALVWLLTGDWLGGSSAKAAAV